MSAIAGLWTAHNLSLYSVPAAWAIAFAPHFYAFALYNKERAPGTGEWDNTFPKRNIVNVKEGKLSPYMQDRYLRAEATQQNGFENLPLFAVAVSSCYAIGGCMALTMQLAGNLARIPAKTMNSLTAFYLVSRIVYSYLYINGTSKTLGNARSAVFLSGIGTIFTLFIRAGNRLFTALPQGGY